MTVVTDLALNSSGHRGRLIAPGTRVGIIGLQLGAAADESREMTRAGWCASRRQILVPRNDHETGGRLRGEHSRQKRRGFDLDNCARGRRTRTYNARFFEERRRGGPHPLLGGMIRRCLNPGS